MAKLSWDRCAAVAVASALVLSVVPTPAAAVPSASESRSAGVLIWGDESGISASVKDTPVPVAFDVSTVAGRPPGVIAAAGGALHSLVLKGDGAVLAWGSNDRGQLGTGGSGTTGSTPVAVKGLGPGSGVVAVAAGEQHSLALLADGSVLAWGYDEQGQLGDGEPKASQDTPVPVKGLGPGSGVVAISAGGDASLALLADGSVLAWGGGCCVSSPHPVPAGIAAGSGIVAVDTSGWHNLAVRGDGAVFAWGLNSSGQLGIGTGSDTELSPTPVPGLGAGSGVVDIAAGGRHSLALTSDGRVLAWGGTTYGQLGNDFASSGATPSQVSNLGRGSGVVQVAAGEEHSLALRADGSIVAWGRDSEGQVGELGDRPIRSAPVPVTGLGAGSGVWSIEAGYYHSLAISTFDQGYGLVAADGGVFAVGSAGFFGSMAGIRLHRPMVGMAYTTTARGYWLVASDGGIFAFGDAQFFGSAGGLPLNRPIVGVERTPSGNGYWLVASDGGVFAYGDATFLGSTGGVPLNAPVVDMERTPEGDGYWLVAADGGVFAFGAARFSGSAAGLPTNAPVVGMTRTSTGGGYHLVEADGSTRSFGDAPDGFVDPVTGQQPSTGLPPGVASPPDPPVVGIIPTPWSGGHWTCRADGAVNAAGDAFHLGGVAGVPLSGPIVGCDATLNLSG